MCTIFFFLEIEIWFVHTREKRKDNCMGGIRCGECIERDLRRKNGVVEGNFDISWSTLERRVHGKNIFAVESAKHLGSKWSVLPRNLEDELDSYAILLESMLFGLTRMDMRRLAYQLAEKNGYKHQFSMRRRLQEKIGSEVSSQGIRSCRFESMKQHL